MIRGFTLQISRRGRSAMGRVPRRFISSHFQVRAEQSVTQSLEFPIPRDPTKPDRADRHTEHLTKIVELVETLIEDPAKMKVLHLPRSFPFIENKEKMRRLAEKQFSVVRQHQHVNNDIQIDLTEFLKATANIRLTGFGPLEKYLLTMNSKQFNLLKNTLLARTKSDPSFYKDKFYPVIRALYSNDKFSSNEVRRLLDLTSFYEVVVPACIYQKNYEEAISHHLTLFALIQDHHYSVNWLPIIISAILDKDIRGLETLMKIHFTLDFSKDGFFEYIIPLLSDCTDIEDLNNLAKWSYVLVKLGDIPSSSKGCFTDVVSLLLKNKFHRSVLYIFHELRGEKNMFTVNNGNWASKRFIGLMMQCVNFNQSRDQISALDNLIETFDNYEYLNDHSFWLQLYRTVKFRDKVVAKQGAQRIEYWMKKFDVELNNDVYTAKCLTSREDEVFLANFDSLINHHDYLLSEGYSSTLSPKVLAIFIRILVNHFPQDSEESAQNFDIYDDTQIIARIDESFDMLKNYVNAAKVEKNNSQNFFLLCYELSRGFLTGLLANEKISVYQKLGYSTRLEAFIYDSLANTPSPLDFPSQRSLVRLESQILKFKLSLGQFDESVERLNKLADNIKRINERFSFKIRLEPQVSESLTDALSRKIFKNLGQDSKNTFNSQELDFDNNKSIVLALKTLIKMRSISPEFVTVSAWSSLLMTTAKVRSFHELEHFTWWLVKTVGRQGPDEIKVKVTHVSHPLNKLFSMNSVARLLRMQFMKSEKGLDYEPWKILELLLKVADITGIMLDDNLVRKQIKWGLMKLYVEDFSILSPEWRALRLKNSMSSKDMIAKFNEVWIKTYDTPLDDSLELN